MPRSVSASGLSAALAGALVALGCAAPPARQNAAIHDYEMRERVGRVAIGQTADEAHAILGRDPVHRPGRPAQPFPSPVRAVALETPRGESLRVEVYVVAARRAAEGTCPDVHVEEVPVVFRDGAVAARSWEEVEASWRTWGGSLEGLRRLRDTHECRLPTPASSGA